MIFTHIWVFSFSRIFSWLQFYVLTWLIIKYKTVTIRFHFFTWVLRIAESLPPANEVWGKVIFLHLSVILFTGGGLPQCMLGYHPPGPCNPPKLCTPRPCTPPGTEHAGRYGQRAGGTHPTGMQSCLITDREELMGESIFIFSRLYTKLTGNFILCQNQNDLAFQNN